MQPDRLRRSSKRFTPNNQSAKPIKWTYTIEKLERKLGEAHHLDHLGQAHEQQGDYRRAITCYEAALAAAQILGDRRAA